MKVSVFFSIIFFAGVILLASCSGDSSKSETKTSDSSSGTSEALAQLNDQLTKEPNNADLYHQRAKYYLAAKQFNKGLEDMQHAMNIDSTKAAYFLTLSDLYFVSNQTGASKRAL